MSNQRSRSTRQTASRSSSNPPISATPHQEIVAASRINALLARIRVPITISSLSECVSSLWVALLEGLLETRLSAIIRIPDTHGSETSTLTRASRLQNAQAVIWALEQEILHIDLPHIKSENIVDGDSRTLIDLVTIIWEISQALESSSVRDSDNLDSLPAHSLQQQNVDTETNHSQHDDKAIMGLIEDISTIDSRDSVSFEKDSAEYPIHRTLLPPSVMAASILAPHMEKYVSHVKRNLQQTIDANNPNRVQKKKPAVVSKLMAGLSRPNPHLHKEGRSTYTSSRAFDVGKDQPTSNISRRERDDFSKKKDKIHRSTVHQQKQSKLASPDRQSSLDSSDLDFDSCGATVETSSTPAFKSANRIAKPGHKHIRFQSQTDQYHTPEILRVTKHDTPHTRALKLRRAILLRQKHTGARNRSPFIMQKKLQDMQRQHQQAMKNGIMASPFKQSPMSKEQSRNHDRNDVDYYEDRAVVDENFSSNLDKSYSKFKGDYVDGADPIKDQDLDGFGKRSRRQLFSDKSKPSRNDQTQFAKLSPPRQNIQAFEDCVRKTIPVVHSKFLTESQRESLWSSQLSTWTRALDDRLWTRKEKRKDQAALRHNAKVNLNEKVRRLKRMDQIHNSAQEQVERIADQRYFGEEKMVKGLLDEYIKAQRLAIIEERRLERDTQKKSNEQKKIKEMSRRKLYPFFHLGYCDQIDMLNEQLAETKREEALVKKVQNEEMRTLVREQKEHAKERIQQIKDKLDQDWGRALYEQEAADAIRRRIKFQLLRSRHEFISSHTVPNQIQSVSKQVPYYIHHRHSTMTDINSNVSLPLSVELSHNNSDTMNADSIQNVESKSLILATDCSADAPVVDSSQANPVELDMDIDESQPRAFVESGAYTDQDQFGNADDQEMQDADRQDRTGRSDDHSKDDDKEAANIMDLMHHQQESRFSHAAACAKDLDDDTLQSAFGSDIDDLEENMDDLGNDSDFHTTPQPTVPLADDDYNINDSENDDDVADSEDRAAQARDDDLDGESDDDEEFKASVAGRPNKVNPTGYTNISDASHPTGRSLRLQGKSPIKKIDMIAEIETASADYTRGASTSADEEDLNADILPGLGLDKEDAKKARELMQIARQDARKAQELTEDSFEKLYDLKMEELQLEISLITSGKHPECMQQLAEIETRKELRLRETADRLGYKISNCEAAYEAGIKLVQDSFLASHDLKCIRPDGSTAILARYSHCFLVPFFASKATTIHNRKRQRHADYSNGNVREDFEERVPTWARVVLRNRNNNQSSKPPGEIPAQVFLPNPCIGLDENEIEQDVLAMNSAIRGFLDVDNNQE
ncbi:hypothetical protein BDEG_22822 [Batrachochytrium dendrobatidis JEL423]|uniref:DUF5745 domain-containing protein n=1 Tax=Batrachochytrium dendrobatidis (strain JEL423) TaxID=403673 RepID=A0A177WGN3_BATDL|nr:hypothetical protein BDEG_22822 [Batrachochytrium dendrobatidis JEL423]